MDKMGENIFELKYVFTAQFCDQIREMFYNSNKSCVTLNELETTSKWAVNSTEPALNFNVLMFPPLLSYTDWHITRDNTSLLYYQFCGPFIVLLI